MEGTPESGTNENGFRVLWIIWAAMLGSLFMYIIICHQWGDQIRQTMNADIPLDATRKILYGIAVVTLILTHFLRKLMLGRNTGDSKGPSSPLATYSIALIVSLALSESIGIYGLVLFLLGDSFQTLHIFIGVSALAMFYYRPKREDLESLAAAMQTKARSAPEL
jgi:hypothetical protein